MRKRYGSKGESGGNQPHKKAKVLEERKMEEDEKAKGEEAFYFLLPKFILPILKQANFRQIVNAITNANFVIFFAFL